MKLKKLGAVLSTSLGRRTAADPKRGIGTRAFTAIELTGVLAIIVMLSAAVIPNVIRRIDLATCQRETSDLKVMANGLVQTILKDKQITNDLPTAIAKYLDLPVSQVTNTTRGFSRRFMVDPNLKINGAGLPYVQGNGGSSLVPTNARVLILSTIAAPAVSNITDSFATIWNTLPGGKPSSWTGKAEDLCIQRVELGALFHKLYLLNLDTNNNGYYTLEANTPSYVVPSGGRTNIYVLDGTALNLYAGGFNVTNLQLRVILNQDESFIYQDNRWTRDLTSGKINETLGEYGTWVQKFLTATAPPYPDNNCTPQAVVDQFYTYLWAYWVWASTGAGFQGIADGTTTVQNPLYSIANDAQAELNVFSNNLIH